MFVLVCVCVCVRVHVFFSGGCTGISTTVTYSEGMHRGAEQKQVDENGKRRMR